MTIIKFSKEEIAEVPNVAGIYALFGRAQNLLYVGHSSILRHRLLSYIEIDDDHETKQELRPLIKWFAFEPMEIEQARRLEKTIKTEGALPHNFR